MVNHVSGNLRPINPQDIGSQDIGSLQIEHRPGATGIGKIDGQPPAQEAPSAGILADEADISDAARAAYEKDKEAFRLSRLAQRTPESYDAEKVSHFRELLDSGRIDEYLSAISPDALADDMLRSAPGSLRNFS